MSQVGYPSNQRAAVEQHRSGHADHWNACHGCGAQRGEQCYRLSMRRPALLGTLPRPYKLRPCAGRTWRARP